MSKERYRALLIGNWDYDDPNKRLQPLKGPRHDLDRLRDALTDAERGLFLPDNVEVRDNLSSQKMGMELERFVNQAQRDDALLIYFSGHGERLLKQQLGLCGTDVDSRYKSTCYDTTSLRDLLETANRAASTIVVLDCCYAGQMKGGTSVLDDQVLEASFGQGTFVLASGGNEPSGDATVDESPSPFTAALVDALLDPDLPGDASGYVTVDDIYTALVRCHPPLLPAPHRKAQGKGGLPIALRQVPQGAEARPELKGFQPSQHFEMVDVTFNGMTVVARWLETDVEDRLELDRLDIHRLAAIRRLGQLSDAVVCVREYSDDPAWRLAVRRAWDCVGANLAETALPPRLKERLAATAAAGARDAVLHLRLGFEGDGQSLAAYPWERLHIARPAADLGGPPELPMALREGLLIERLARVSERRPPARTDMAPTVAVVNCLKPPFDAVGHAAARDLVNLPGVTVVADLAGATWENFVDSLEHRPHYLLLFAPVRRDGAVGDVGFVDTTRDEPDWRSGAELAERLRGLSLGFHCIVLVSFSAKPAGNAVRANTNIARQLADADVGPVAFACHAQGYERHFVAAGARSFPSLLIDAHTRRPDSIGDGGTEPSRVPLQRAFHYAVTRVVLLATDEARLTFGVPGLYRPPDSESAAGRGQRGLATSGRGPGSPRGGVAPGLAGPGS